MGRRGYGTLAVLKAIAGGHHHGFDIIDVTGFPGGTVYPTLGKLEDGGYVRSRWEDPRVAQAEKRPQRRYYELRPDGTRLLQDLARRFGEPVRARLRVSGARARRA